MRSQRAAVCVETLRRARAEYNVHKRAVCFDQTNTPSERAGAARKTQATVFDSQIRVQARQAKKRAYVEECIRYRYKSVYKISGRLNTILRLLKTSGSRDQRGRKRHLQNKNSQRSLTNVYPIMPHYGVKLISRNRWARHKKTTVGALRAQRLASKACITSVLIETVYHVPDSSQEHSDPHVGVSAKLSLSRIAHVPCNQRLLAPTSSVYK